MSNRIAPLMLLVFSLCLPFLFTSPLAATTATDQTFQAIADTTVFSGASGANYGTSANLTVGHITGDTNGTYRTLIRFDLSAIPAGSTINSARLLLYAE